MPAVKFEDDCLTAADVRARNRETRDRLRKNYQRDMQALAASRSPQSAPVPKPRIGRTSPPAIAPIAVPPVAIPTCADLPHLMSAEFAARAALWPLCPSCRARVTEAMKRRDGRVLVNDVLNAVSQVWRISGVDIKSHRRTKDVLVPRQVAMALARRLTFRSLPYIGAQIGGRDHTTVLHGARKYERLLDLIGARIGEAAAATTWAVECWKEIERGWVPPRPGAERVAA